MISECKAYGRSGKSVRRWFGVRSGFAGINVMLRIEGVRRDLRAMQGLRLEYPLPHGSKSYRFRLARKPKEAFLLPTWASTTEPTCNALGEGEGFFRSF